MGNRTSAHDFPCSAIRLFIGDRDVGGVGVFELTDKRDMPPCSPLAAGLGFALWAGVCTRL